MACDDGGSLVKGQSFKGIYPEVLKKVEPFLVKKYAPLVSGFKFLVSREGLKKNKCCEGMQ